MYSKHANISDGTAKLISDSVLLALVQMRGESFHDIAAGITPRITTLTGGDTWKCIIGNHGECGWKNTSVSWIICQTDDLDILLYR